MLILTQVEDPTADLVLDELNRRGVAFFRCDPGDYPASLVLSARHGDGSAPWAGHLYGKNRGVALESIRSVYYRRPSEFRFPEQMSSSERRFANAAARHAVAGVLAGLGDVRWVNHPSAMADARVKPYQLAVASRCGLATPATLLTNDPQDVAAFAVEVGGRIVTKALTASTVTEQGRSGVVYTTEVSSERWDDPAIATTAHLFQEFVPGVDVRLTMVGQSVFSAAIHPRHAEEEVVDIRAHHADVDYSMVAVPDRVRLACQRMLDRLGLIFGAFDFRVDQRRWTLLELNPNGQWAFVPELRTPIASALADVIEEGIAT